MNTPRRIRALVLACGLAAAGAAGAQSFEHPESPHSAPPPHSQGPVHTPPPAAQAPHYANPAPHYTSPTAVQTTTSHYYPPHGVTVVTPPPSPVVINHPSGRYYYSGGVWYAPRGPSYVVVAAPVGVFVPVLPPYYSTVWVSGAPYYYANQTYYQWSPEQNSYEVVAPPDPNGIPAPEDPDAAAPPAPSPPPPQANDNLYVYPQNGQSEQQQATDRYECHKWADVQTGFDPTQNNGGNAGGSPDDYQRAMKACLEGRGYSVR
jgi:hypothetical protein